MKIVCGAAITQSRRRARELGRVRQTEVLDAVREAARMRAEALVDVEHLIDRHVADRVRRDPPSGRVRLAAQLAQFAARRSAARLSASAWR